MWKSRILAALFIILGILAGYFDIAGSFSFTPDFLKREFSLGPDLQGGISLEYKADTSSIPDSERSDAMAGLRDIIENRVNLFGVSEPIIQVKKRGDEDRLIVELAGVFDIDNAIKIIGETPYLEFQTLKTGVTIEDLQKKQDAQDFVGVLGSFEPTKLTGRFLQKALLEYNQTPLESTVGLEFNNEGRDLFAKITKENIGKPVAIFLDGIPISMPTVREEITQGQAVISGNFSREEARKFVRNLNSGALPVPISLIKEETLGAYLGADTLNRMLQAGFYGIIGVALLLIYTSLALTLFKLIPIYLTAAGIAGFILSIGMAVDANILIFERTKEELRGGKSLAMAVEEGFSRAWLSIRDYNVSSLITSIILFYLGSQSVAGFALTLGLGIVLSMLSAITITRTFLRAVEFRENSFMRKIYGASYN